VYKAFYSLYKDLFTKEIKPEDYFAFKSWNEATARLLTNTRGIGMLVGEPGSGKTFALRNLASSLNPALYKVVYLPLSTGTVMDFYRGLARSLSEEPGFRKIDLFEQIQQGVLKLFQDKRITPVFILDEMHLASPKFLLDLSLLFNFSMDSLNPFVLILAGLLFLMNHLNLNQTQSLAHKSS
jgi:type II secretory pathway predicted ATPase ExeA